MVKFKIVVVSYLSAILISCVGKPPTEYGKQMLQKIDAQKQAIGLYPNTMEGNLVDKRNWDIKTNDFFYIVDSTRTSFTLKIFNKDGQSDNYDSKTKQWVRTDK